MNEWYMVISEWLLKLNKDGTQLPDKVIDVISQIDKFNKEIDEIGMEINRLKSSVSNKTGLFNMIKEFITQVIYIFLYHHEFSHEYIYKEIYLSQSYKSNLDYLSIRSKIKIIYLLENDKKLIINNLANMRLSLGKLFVKYIHTFDYRYIYLKKSIFSIRNNFDNNNIASRKIRRSLSGYSAK